MSADKYPTTILHQKEAVVYVLSIMSTLNSTYNTIMVGYYKFRDSLENLYWVLFQEWSSANIA